jgi:hypothetical protein
MGNAMANDPAGENFSGGGFFVGAAAAVIFSLPAWGLYSLGAKILKNVLALRAELAAASTGA